MSVGAAVAEWLSSWLAEQEDRGSIPGLATWIFRDWLSPASKSRYGWKIAKSTLVKTTNQPTNIGIAYLYKCFLFHFSIVPNNTDREWKQPKAKHAPKCTMTASRKEIDAPRPPYLTDGSVTIYSNSTASASYGLPKQGDCKQNRSTDGFSELKSPDTRQVQERLVSTLEHMQVPKWDRTRCPEE